jgi:uncharacterized OB-fold protein
MNLPEVPPADDVTTGWWDATREHRLTVQVCTQCSHVQHPPRAVCTACSSMDHLALQDAAGTATIDVHTVVHRAPRPDVEVPYTLARVRLAEGPLLLTRLTGSNDWTIGDPVVVDWVDLPDGRALPVFHRTDG